MKIHRILPVLCLAVLALSLPAVLRADADKAKKKSDIAVPATLQGLWTEINTQHKKLSEALAAKKLAEADPAVMALDVLVAALPDKSKDLPEAKQKTLAGMVKNADKAIDGLDEAIDGGKQDAADAKLKLLDGVLKIMRAQYAPEISGAGQ